MKNISSAKTTISKYYYEIKSVWARVPKIIHIVL